MKRLRPNLSYASRAMQGDPQSLPKESSMRVARGAVQGFFQQLHDRSTCDGPMLGAAGSGPDDPYPGIGEGDRPADGLSAR